MLDILIAFCVIFTLGHLAYYLKSFFAPVARGNSQVVSPNSIKKLSEQEIFDILVSAFKRLTELHDISPLYLTVDDLFDTRYKFLFPSLFNNVLFERKDAGLALERLKIFHDNIYYDRVNMEIYKTRISECSICGKACGQLPTIGSDGKVRTLNICATCEKWDNYSTIRKTCCFCNKPCESNTGPVFHSECLPDAYKKKSMTRAQFPYWYRRQLQISRMGKNIHPFECSLKCVYQDDYFPAPFPNQEKASTCEICKFLSERAFVSKSIGGIEYTFVRIEFL